MKTSISTILAWEALKLEKDKDSEKNLKKPHTTAENWVRDQLYASQKEGGWMPHLTHFPLVSLADLNAIEIDAYDMIRKLKK